MAKKRHTAAIIAVLALGFVVSEEAAIVEQPEADIGDGLEREGPDIDIVNNRDDGCSVKNDPAAGTVVTITRDFISHESNQMIQKALPPSAIKSGLQVTPKGLLDGLLPPVLLGLEVGRRRESRGFVDGRAGSDGGEADGGT